MILKYLFIRYFLILIFTIGILTSSFSQDTIGSLNLNQSALNQVEKENARWERQRINSTIIDRDGQVFEGQILYLNDSVVYQYLSRDKYDPNEFLNATIKFNINDIEQINIYRKGQTMRALKIATLWGLGGTLALTFLTEESAWGRLWNLFGATVWVMPASTLTGVVVGSGKKIDVQFNTNEFHQTNPEFLSSLNKYALFPINPPSGLNVTFSNEKKDLKNLNTNDEIQLDTKNDSQEIINYNDFKSPFYISKFHFQAGVDFSANYLNSILRNDFNDLGYYEAEIRDPFLNDLKLDFGISYQIIKHLRVGLTFHPKSYWTEGLYKQSLGNKYFVLSNLYSYGSSTENSGRN